MTYTIQQFAEAQGYTVSWVQKIIKRNQLPKGYKLFEKTKKERYIIKEQVEKPKYKHASKLTAKEILFINNALADDTYRLKSGRPNLKAIAKHASVHYDTLYRYVNGKYKKKDESRADKGKCRAINKKDLKIYKSDFISFYLANAQDNVQQAIWKVEVKHKVSLKSMSRRFYEWASEVRSIHTMSHYYKNFIAKYTPHIHRDNWMEVPNFLDEVMSDVWKIDDPFIPEAVNPNYSLANMKGVSNF